MLPVKPALPANQRKLLGVFSKLPPSEREQLQAYAEFLQQRAVAPSATEQPVQPLTIERPEKETVIAAMRRLSTTYPSLDTSGILDQASVLMSSHLLQGKSAEDVISQLQELFEAAHIGAGD